MHLLHIDSSPLGTASVSRQLTERIVGAWTAAHPGTAVAHLDLAAEPPAHFAPGASEAEQARTERLLDQFLAADVVVVGAPMYNFSVPSQLKAWIDRVAQAGRTFRYTAEGPQGLAGGKTVIVASTRGGQYAGTPFEAALDHQESYLKAVFGFFGITDVRVVRAEGLNMGDAARAAGIAAATRDIAALTGTAANQDRVALAA